MRKSLHSSIIEKKLVAGKSDDPLSKWKKDAQIDTGLLSKKSKGKDVGQGVIDFFKQRGEKQEAVVPIFPLNKLSSMLNFAHEEMGTSDIAVNPEGFMNVVGGNSSFKNLDDAVGATVNVGGIEVRLSKLGNILLGYNAEKRGIGRITTNIGSGIASRVLLGSGTGERERADRALYESGRRLAKQQLTTENLKQAIVEGVTNREKYFNKQINPTNTIGRIKKYLRQSVVGLK